SLLMRDIILLRTLSIASGLIGIFYNFFAAPTPLWVPIIWLALFIVINGYMIINFYHSNRQTGLSAEDFEIWQSNFLGLTADEYRRIQKLFEFQTYALGDHLTRIGRDNHFLFFVTAGQLDVRRDGELINTLTQGDLVGEMSFLSTHASANADVVAHDQTKCIVIDKTKLRSIMAKHPALQLSIANLFNQNLMKKLAT
ncbi:uncharacterized protein METZ01_LOCUS328110, partial [marine metagenome]